MTPREKSAQFSRAPPLKILNSAATLPLDSLFTCEANHVWRTCAFTPGQVIAAPMRTTTSMTSVKSTRFRSSGILKVLVKAEIIVARRNGSRLAEHYRPVRHASGENHHFLESSAFSLDF